MYDEKKNQFLLPEILFGQEGISIIIVSEYTHKSNYYMAIVLWFSSQYDKNDRIDVCQIHPSSLDSKISYRTAI